MSIKNDPKSPPISPVNLDSIPQDLKDIPRWAMWAWTWNKKKWDKPPLQTNGNAAANNNAKHWGDFDKAAKALEDKKAFSGIGFTLGDKGCGYTVIDLDNCIDEIGLVEPWAQEILESMDSYAEVSPSGEGMKIWVKGMIPEGEWASRRGNLEIYDKGRYLTITGQVVDGFGKIKAADKKLLNFLVDNMARGESADKGRPDDLEWTVACATEALEYIDPDVDYDDWVRVGMALHWLDKEMFDTWDNWSATGGKYEDSAKCRQHWDSFGRKSSKVTVGSLFHLAKQNGFVMPKKEFRKTDIGVAKQVCEVLSGRAFFVFEWGKWVTWTGKNFSVGKRKEITNAIEKVSEDLMARIPPSDGSKEDDRRVGADVAHALRYQSYNGVNAVRNLAEDYLTSSFSDLDNRNDLFHCDNVTLVLDSDKATVDSLAHNPEFKNTHLSPVAYVPGARCPTWDKFIREITSNEKGEPSEALAKYLQQIVGFCLTGRTDDQSLYILHGGGNNGKGAFCRTILKLLGGFGAAVNQSLLIETKKQEHLTQFATLYGKRCVITQETDQGCKLNEAQVKQLTGSDNIRCRRMREDEWEFTPTHKLLLATNSLPIIRGTDLGIWRRVKLIPFNAKVVPDPKMEPALTSELSGILNWAIEGFKSVAKDGFDIPAEVEIAKAEYRDDMDIVKQFVEDKCVLSPELTTKNEELFANIDLYCKSLGQHTPSLRKITLDLQRLGVKSARKNNFRFKVGIGILSEF